MSLRICKRNCNRWCRGGSRGWRLGRSTPL